MRARPSRLQSVGPCSRTPCLRDSKSLQLPQCLQIGALSPCTCSGPWHRVPDHQMMRWGSTHLHKPGRHGDGLLLACAGMLGTFVPTVRRCHACRTYHEACHTYIMTIPCMPADLAGGPRLAGSMWGPADKEGADCAVCLHPAGLPMTWRLSFKSLDMDQGCRARADTYQCPPVLLPVRELLLLRPPSALRLQSLRG